MIRINIDKKTKTRKDLSLGVQEKDLLVMRKKKNVLVVQLEQRPNQDLVRTVLVLQEGKIVLLILMMKISMILLRSDVLLLQNQIQKREKRRKKEK